MSGSKNSNILWKAALALMLLAFALALGLRKSQKLVIKPTEERTLPSPFAIATSPSPTVNPPINTDFQKPGGPYVSSDPRWAIARQKDKADPNWEWRADVNFYGRVVDENDRAISGAKISFSWTDLSPAGSTTATSLSDADGAFSLQGKTGRHLQVDVSKEGYYKMRNERLRSFDYAAFWDANYYQADPTHRVTFHLRTKGRPEILTSGEITPIVPADGTPVSVDLFNPRRVSSDGQIEIAAVTNTEKYPPRTFDWRASITVRDGGLLEHNLEFPFEAPEDGYTPQVIFEMPAGAPEWKRSIEKTYFIRFGNPPKYGRIQIRLNGASQRVLLHYAVNPIGSRNLEGSTNGEFATP